MGGWRAIANWYERGSSRKERAAACWVLGASCSGPVGGALSVGAPCTVPTNASATIHGWKLQLDEPGLGESREMSFCQLHARYSTLLPAGVCTYLT